MRIKWSMTDTVYEVLDAGSRVSLKVVDKPGSLPVGDIHYNYTTRAQLDSWLENGIVVRVAEPESMKLEVHTTALDKALATAKELEATLLRIKELWPCSGS